MTTDLLTLVELLAPGDVEITRAVRSAMDEPAVYVERHAKTLRLRGISAPHSELPVIAFSDALIEHGLSEELDWREMPAVAIQTVWSLRCIPSGAAVSEMVPTELEADEERPCIDALRLAERELARAGLALRIFNMRNDAYLVVVVEDHAIPAVEGAAKAADLPLQPPSLYTG